MSLLLALLGPTSSQLVGTPLLTNKNGFFTQIVQLEAVTTPYTFEGYSVITAVASSVTATYISGETVLVVVEQTGPTRPTAVSDGTNTYTYVGGNTTGNFSIAVFKVDNVVGGTYTLSSSTPATCINYYRYRNIKAGAAQVVITGEVGNPGSVYTNNVELPSITPVQLPAMIFAAGGDQNEGGLYVGTEFISRDGGNIQAVAGDRRVTTTKTITPTFTGSAFEWTDYVVAIFTEAPVVSKWLYPQPIQSSNAFFAPTVGVIGGSQTLTPALYSNNSSYYNPTITTGAITLTPTLYSNNSSYYNPTITTGAITLTPALYSNNSSYYNPTITTGAITLTPALYSNNSSYYNPTITTGAITLTPSLYSNSSTYYTPTITIGATLQPNLYSNSSTYYNPTITISAVTLTPSLYSNNNTYYTPTITTGVVTLTTPLLNNTTTLITPTVLPGVITLTPSVLTSGNVYYLPTVTKGAATVAPALFTNTSAPYTPTVVPGAVGVQVPAIASNSAMYVPAVYVITNVGIELGNFISYADSNNVIVDNINYYYSTHVLNEDYIVFTEVPHYLTNVIVDNYIQAA